MQRYGFVTENGTIDIIEKSMVRAITAFKRAYGDLEHSAVLEYRAGRCTGGVEKVGDKWAAYIVE